MGGAGIVSIANFPASFHGSNRFVNNRGVSLLVSPSLPRSLPSDVDYCDLYQVVGALVRVSGNIQFRNNDNVQSLDGGALYMTTLGQLELSPNASLLFRNNSGL